jgi:hypothetical protein
MMDILVPNSIEMTADQLLNVTERLIAEYYDQGLRISPTPYETDIWAMLKALNWTLWLCPNTGHEAVRLLRQRYPHARLA